LILRIFTGTANRLRFGWTEAGFLALLLGALVMRLWQLDGRTMHYDEAIHLQAAWGLARGNDYLHSAWMHGPFQIEYTALFIWVFGDTDFTARVGYTFFGAALVGLPYFLKDYIGRAAAFFTAILLALSPVLLYFSRFGRNDIIMAFWAASLLVLLWRYSHEGRSRYLFMASAVMAFMFATKETAYIVTLIFGGITFLLALPSLVPVALNRDSLSTLTGPAGFFLLLLTLTLPQWMPLFSLGQDSVGLVLAARDGTEAGLVGAPLWAGPNLLVPIYAAPWWLHCLAALLLAAVLGRFNIAFNGSANSMHSSLVWLGPRFATPLAITVASVLTIVRPLSRWFEWVNADVVTAGILAFAGLAIVIATKHPWRQSTLLVLVPVAISATYITLFTGVIYVGSVVSWLLPDSVGMDAATGEIPINYLVAGGLLLGSLTLSAYLGVRWLGGQWVGIAGAFYVIWTALYTTFFTNFAGIFSGAWQGMGYWIAQQEVARGNQPWYYYFVGLSVYEFLPLAFGIAGAIHFVKNGHILGVVIASWAAANTLIYTVTSEKMPWLLVNLTLPFILLAGIYLGDLANRVQWRHVTVRGTGAILGITPVIVSVAFYLIYTYVTQVENSVAVHWGLLTSIATATVATAYLVRLASPKQGLALAGLGVAAMLLGFSVWASVRAAYTYDDSNVEILVYAQGSADLKETYEDLDRQVFSQAPLDTKVIVDYDVWYPFQWYVRNVQEDGLLSFACFKGDSEEGTHDGCNRVSEAPAASARLLTLEHGDRDKQYLAEFEQKGPLQNLLWFPESYRRPGENRQHEGSFSGFRGIPSKEQFTKDLTFFRTSATNRESWSRIIDYWLSRKLEQPWYDSKYYSYIP